METDIEDVQDFGALIRATRKKYNVSQTFLSKHSGVSRATISNIENQKAGDTLLSTAIKLSNVLNQGLFLQEVKK